MGFKEFKIQGRKLLKPKEPKHSKADECCAICFEPGVFVDLPCSCHLVGPGLAAVVLVSACPRNPILQLPVRLAGNPYRTPNTQSKALNPKLQTQNEPSNGTLNPKLYNKAEAGSGFPSP